MKLTDYLTNIPEPLSTIVLGIEKKYGPALETLNNEELKTLLALCTVCADPGNYLVVSYRFWLPPAVDTCYKDCRLVCSDKRFAFSFIEFLIARIQEGEDLIEGTQPTADFQTKKRLDKIADKLRETNSLVEQVYDAIAIAAMESDAMLKDESRYEREVKLALDRALCNVALSAESLKETFDSPEIQLLIRAAENEQILSK